MQHAEFRKLFGANPKRTETEVLAHRASCAQCDQYARDLERVDALVSLGAIKLPAPKGIPPWELEKQRAAARSPLRWYALAASLLVAVAIGAGALWVRQDHTKLIAEVVKHADKERDLLIVSDKRTSEARLRRTLAQGGATLLRDLPISVARLCKVRGEPAPHFVVQTESGPVAILLMQKQRFLASRDFVELGYEGTIVPKGGNSIAVIGSSKEAVELAAKLVDAGIEWPKVPPEIPPPPPKKTDAPAPGAEKPAASEPAPDRK